MQRIELKYCELYAYADLAAGKDAKAKKHTARQTIVVGARDWLERWFWVYLWAGRLTTSQFKDRILLAQETFEPRKFGLEANGMQILFGSIVREEARLKFGKGVKIVPIYQPTNVDKNYRIRTGIEPVIIQGRFFLQSKEIDARAEITGFPTAHYKDIVDSMETCMNQVAPRRARKKGEDREAEEYAAYLRKSGMKGNEIQREMERFSVAGAR